MVDRRAGRVPHVRGPGGGLLPRARNKNGRWRRKRSDAGRSRCAALRATAGLRAA